MKIILLILCVLAVAPLKAATLSWSDTNSPGTRFIISNRIGGAWQWLANTTNKSIAVTLTPGTNTFSLTASNGLLSDPAITSTNQPSRVFNVIIEAANDVQGPFETLTNLPSFVATVEQRRFYRLRATIE